MPSCDFLPSFFALTLVTVAPARAQVDVDASGQATFSGNARFTAAIGVGVDPNASVTRVLIHHTATTFDGSGLRVVGSAPSSQFVRGLVSTLATTPGWGVAGAFEGGWVGVYGQASGAPDIFPAGVYGIAAGGTGNMGVRGVANGTGMGTTNYGVIGTAVGGSVTNVGVYGETEASPGVRYAGYFNGDVHVTGQVSSNSDARLKENIRSLDGADVLGRLLRIAPRRYTFRREASAMGKGLSAGGHYGVLAQEVEAEFPLLVKEVPVLSGPSLAGGNGTGAGAEPAPTYKAVTYVEMIPLLLRALQEQQGQIEAQREQSAALRSALAAAGIRVGQ